jgi:energy-converting hydrogenase Eha subunit G
MASDTLGESQRLVAMFGTPHDTAHGNERDCMHFEIISHTPFALVFVLSIYMHIFEMTVLVGLVLVSSLHYHLHAERMVCVSYLDNCAAFALSVYGNVQLFFSPTAWILALNLSLGTTSGIIFVLVYTTRSAPYYHIMHPIWLHILPAIWACTVVIFQQPLIF